MAPNFLESFHVKIWIEDPSGRGERILLVPLTLAEILDAKITKNPIVNQWGISVIVDAAKYQYEKVPQNEMFRVDNISFTTQDLDKDKLTVMPPPFSSEVVHSFPAGAKLSPKYDIVGNLIAQALDPTNPTSASGIAFEVCFSEEAKCRKSSVQQFECADSSIGRVHSQSHKSLNDITTASPQTARHNFMLEERNHLQGSLNSGGQYTESFRHAASTGGHNSPKRAREYADARVEEVYLPLHKSLNNTLTASPPSPGHGSMPREREDWKDSMRSGGQYIEKSSDTASIHGYNSQKRPREREDEPDIFHNRRKPEHL